MPKILIIEDEAQIRNNLQEILTLADFETCIAENGKIGVELVENERPDLILCDLMMPAMDGYEVLTVLNRDRRSQTIPFIFLTAKTERADVRQGMELGADDYLTKPFTPDEVLKAINTRLAKQESRVESIRESSLYEVERLKKGLMTRSQQLNRDWQTVQDRLAALNGESKLVWRDRLNAFLFLFLATGFAGLFLFAGWFLFFGDRDGNSHRVRPALLYLTAERGCGRSPREVWQHNAC
ncbi:MAG: response regulator [Cyanobacteria bacterium SBLK]|nr:response regulator [Cyanobacteria bacterium SBLK]